MSHDAAPPHRLHAVIPFKSGAPGKTRLGQVLTEPERSELVRAMAAHVIDTVSRAPGIEQVHLLTSDPQLVPRSCAHLPDPGGGLNAALAQAARALRALGAERMVIVHADLPFLQEEEVRALILASAEDALVAAPDLAEVGTNALAFPLARPIRTCFGPGSLKAHRRAAAMACVPFLLVRRRGLACDIDEPAQLDALAERGGAPYAFLRSALTRRAAREERPPEAPNRPD